MGAGNNPKSLIKSKVLPACGASHHVIPPELLSGCWGSLTIPWVMGRRSAQKQDRTPLYAGCNRCPVWVTGPAMSTGSNQHMNITSHSRVWFRSGVSYFSAGKKGFRVAAKPQVDGDILSHFLHSPRPRLFWRHFPPRFLFLKMSLFIIRLRVLSLYRSTNRPWFLILPSTLPANRLFTILFIFAHPPRRRLPHATKQTTRS